VDPPNWWANHSINPVRLLIRGRHLAGARLECPRLRCSAARVNARGTYAFVDVTVPAGAAAGRYPLTLRTAAGSAPVTFRVDAPLARAGRFQGFDANDVVYLIMPDRFANGDTANDDPAVSRGIRDRAEPRRYHGGDLAGVRRGCRTSSSWASRRSGSTRSSTTPTSSTRSRWPTASPTTAYHGYHAIDYYGVEERFGDLAEVRRLVDAAHAQGHQGHLDMVANHTSAYHPWVDDSPTPTWYNGTGGGTWPTRSRVDHRRPVLAARAAPRDARRLVRELPPRPQPGRPRGRALPHPEHALVGGVTGSTASGRTRGSTCRAPSGATG
jgi:hypothetical protein